MALFEWGVAFHDLDFEAIRKGEKSKEQVREELKGIAGKARTPDRQGLHRLAALERDHRRRSRRAPRRAPGARPQRGDPRPRALPAPRRRTAAASPTLRSTSQAHLPLDAVGGRDRERRPQRLVATRSSSAATSPTRPTRSAERRSRTRRSGGWYVRQLVGAANIEGSPLFHVDRGNLGYQVEHHLFPDMPSTRYARDRAAGQATICERYGLPYNTGPVLQAVGHGAADDPAARVPRRQAAAEARPVPRRGHPVGWSATVRRSALPAQRTTVRRRRP